MIWLVARREMLERGRSRGFLFSVLLSVAIIAAGLFLPSLIGSTSTQHLGIAGSPPAGLTDTLQQTAKAAGLEVSIQTVPDLATGETKLRDGSLDAVLVIPPGGGTPTYVVKSRGNALLQQIVVASFTPAPQVSLRELEAARPNRDTSFAFANIGVILLFISMFTFGTWVLTGVVEEKQSRVVEVVLSTVEPRDLLIGKVVGIGLLGVFQLLVMVAAGLGLGILLHRFDLPSTTPLGARDAPPLVRPRLRVLLDGARRPGRPRVADGGGVERLEPGDVHRDGGATSSRCSSP